MDPDAHRPVLDNVAGTMKHSGRRHHHRVSAGQSAPHEHEASKGPIAVSLPGSLPILQTPGVGGNMKGEAIHGIPGIIGSTTTGNTVRRNLVAGILDPMSKGSAPSGPVHAVLGHDATAYNEGMIHIRGAHH